MIVKHTYWNKLKIIVGRILNINNKDPLEIIIYRCLGNRY